MLVPCSGSLIFEYMPGVCFDFSMLAQLANPNVQIQTVI